MQIHAGIASHCFSRETNVRTPNKEQNLSLPEPSPYVMQCFGELQFTSA